MKSRFSMDLELSRQLVTLPYPYKTISETDVADLGELLWLVDQQSIDGNGQDINGSIAEIKEMTDGQFGRFLPAGSLMMLDERKVISATMWTHYPKEDKPLLAMTMTHPIYQNRGLCQLLLKQSINELLDLGYTSCFLSVTKGNLSAIAAYEKIGFKKREGSDWVVQG